MKKQFEELVKQFFIFKRDINDFDLLMNIRQYIRQNLDEMMMVIAYLYPRKFNSFTEIGCAEGGSLWIYYHMLCNPGAFVRAIEIKPLPTFIQICKKFKIEAVKKPSNKAVLDIPDNSIDLLHIDGDHHAEAVNQDWDLYYPKVAKGGIILLHDVIHIPGPRSLRERLEKEKYDIATFYAEHPSRDDVVKPCGVSVVKK